MAKGDRAALEALYKRHSGWLAGRLSRMTQSRDAIEEALQDSFMVYWRTASSYRGEGDVAAWMWGIARRRLMSLTRKRAADLPGAPEETPVLPEEALLQKKDLARVREVVSRLPRDQREVLERVVFGEQSLVDVARSMTIPVGTLKSRLHRVRAHIKSEFETS